MALEFFKNFPEIGYKLSDGRTILIKDFFRKSKIEQEAVNSIIEYSMYELEEGERPDVAATKLYGNPQGWCEASWSGLGPVADFDRW